MSGASDAAAVARAADRLRAGLPVAFPTETVYGLGADAGRDEAVARIYALKGRPAFNPLIAHVADADAAEALVELDDRARALMAAFWPGPLTLVLPRRAGARLSLLATAGLDTVAVRQPAHPVALALLRAFGGAIVAPSANRSGRVSPTTAAHVRGEFAADDVPILDGGPCAVGVESTIVDLTGPRPALLRNGGVPREALLGHLDALDVATEAAPDGSVRSPGQLLSHYAPGRPVRLDATEARPGEALLAFGAAPTEGFTEVFHLSPAGDATEAAARLFAGLRALDRPEFTAIAVSPIPDAGLGRAVNDRLRRAAAGRENALGDGLHRRG